ncbi:hypothetical protein ACKWTF_012718 [Chironomus riparius]
MEKQTIQSFQEFKKSKLEKKRNPSKLLLLEDFLICENTARKVGCTYLKNHENSSNKWLKLNASLCKISLVIFLFWEIMSFIMSVKKKLVLLMLDHFLFSGVFVVCLLKIFIVFYHKRKDVIEAIEMLDKYFPHSEHDQMIFKAQSYLRVLKILEMLYVTVFIIIGTVFCLMPIIHQIYGAIKSIDLEWDLILSIYLPFDQFHPILHAFICFLDAWTICVGSFFIVSTDFIFVSLMQLLAMNFDIISQKFAQLNASENEEEAVKELKKLVDAHQHLNEISEMLDDIFSPLLLINALGSITSLCIAGFLAVVSVDLLRFSWCFWCTFL